jgi:uncharacterized protein (TIGR04255 family)
MPRPLVPNSPLSEVSSEIRFHGDLSLYTAWGEVQRELRADYPKLLVPAAVEGIAPMLQPVHLANRDDSHLVMLAVNTFGVSSRRYGGFEKFKEDLRRVLNVFSRHYDLRLATRMGLRYTNVLPETFGEAGAPGGRLHPCLKLGLSNWPVEQVEHTDQPLLVMNGAVRGLKLRVSLLPRAAVLLNRAVNIQSAVHGIILDLDGYRDGATPVAEFDDFLESAHALIEDTFFGLVTDEYHRYLQGRE